MDLPKPTSIPNTAPASLIPDHTPISTTLPSTEVAPPPFNYPIWAMVLSGFLIFLCCLLWTSICLFLNNRSLKPLTGTLRRKSSFAAAANLSNANGQGNVGGAKQAETDCTKMEEVDLEAARGVLFTNSKPNIPPAIIRSELARNKENPSSRRHGGGGGGGEGIRGSGLKRCPTPFPFLDPETTTKRGNQMKKWGGLFQKPHFFKSSSSNHEETTTTTTTQMHEMELSSIPYPATVLQTTSFSSPPPQLPVKTPNQNPSTNPTTNPITNLLPDSSFPSGFIPVPIRSAARASLQAARAAQDDARRKSPADCESVHMAQEGEASGEVGGEDSVDITEQSRSVFPQSYPKYLG